MHSLAPDPIAENDTSSPAPPARRVTAINRALQIAWERGWASIPTLEPDRLVQKAARQSRCDPDEDGVGWKSRLDRLCADLHDHADLTDLGRTIAHGQIVSALSNRFRAHALWRRHPEIGRQPLTAPIIVVGQMRSGTTRMQRLLACDARLTFTHFYESWNPIPANGDRAGFDGRKLKGWAALKCAGFLNPAFKNIHPTHWHAPDEEIGLHNLSIFGSAFEAQWNIPSYTAAVETEDATAVYGEFKRLLQTLRWLRGDTTDRPWILKVPQFAQDLPALLTIFPDARVIYLSRDPLEIMASSASLVCNQMALQSHAVDPHRVGREWARKVRLREARMTAAKAAATVPQIEVDYADIDRDWAQEMQRVYAMLKLPFDAAVRSAMGAYLQASQPGDRNRHRYHPSQFGFASGSFERATPAT